jgi:hypothetical protein
MVAVSDNLPFTFGVDINRRKRRTMAGMAFQQAAIDFLFNEPVLNQRRNGVVAEARSNKSFAAEPGHRDRRIGGAAAANDDGIAGAVFDGGARQFIHLEHEIQNRDTCAQYACHAGSLSKASIKAGKSDSVSIT